jgi:hypothetical protein
VAGAELTKVKCIHSRDTLRNSLTIDLGSNNKDRTVK